MVRSVVALFVFVVLAFPTSLAAQTGLGGLRGYVRDSQGGALPGVTVTATAPESIRPTVGVTNEEGYYRLINLPPGTYKVTAELTGFSPFTREGILIRAGATFALDVGLSLGAIQETVTVSGDSPMVEVLKPGNVLNIDGDFQRAMPIAGAAQLERLPRAHPRHHLARLRRWQRPPGVFRTRHGTLRARAAARRDDRVELSRRPGHLRGDGHRQHRRRAGEDRWRGCLVADGRRHGDERDHQERRQPLQRLGRLRATSPTTGTATTSQNCSTFVTCNKSGTGTPTTAKINQFDAAIGGPIRKDSLWFFGSIRRAVSAAGISRTSVEVQRINTFFPGAELFDNDSESWQPYLKITGKLGGAHEFNAYFQNDRLLLSGDREYNYEHIMAQSTGGNLFGGKLTSVFGDRLTTTFTASYNNKGGNDISTFETLGLTGPQIIIHNDVNLTAGTLVGTGRVLEGGNLQQYDYQPATQAMIRGDVTYFKDNFAGSHEFQTGIFVAPRSTYDQETEYVNDGFILEERRIRDVNNPAAGMVPFHRRYQSPVNLVTRAAEDRNIGLYVQDTWRPHTRLTINGGVRFDYVKRQDNLFNIVREDAWHMGPRIGFWYMLTRDAKNIIRGSYVRVHEQMMGRDAVTIFGAGGAAEQRDIFDVDGNGTFETERITAARNAALAPYEFDPNVHQPHVDEFIFGLRKQFPGQWSADVSFMKRSYQETYARLEINGFWPSGPNQPFGGFGRVDPNRGLVYQQTNNTWSTLEWKAIEATIAKNMSNNFQVLVGINRQWQHFGGTWNPTDPARFIQPDTFPSTRLLYMPRGNNEENSLPIQTGTTVHTYGPTWQDYSLRFGGTYRAPWGVNLSASYTILRGTMVRTGR